MHIKSKLRKTAKAAGGLIVFLVILYALANFLPYSEDKKTPDITVDPNIIGSEERLDLHEEDYQPFEKCKSNQLISVLENSEDAGERRSIAFRLSYMASPDAEKDLLKFLKDEDPQVAHHCSEALISIWRMSDSSRASRFLELALDAWQKGEYNNARNRLENMAKLDPDVPGLYRLKAETLIRLGDIDSAIEVAKKGIEKKPQLFTAYLTLARCQLKLGNITAAEEYINTALDIYPHYPEAKAVREQLKTH